MCTVVEGNNKRRGPRNGKIRSAYKYPSIQKVHIEKPGGNLVPLEFNYAYKLLFPAATANQSTTCFDEAEGF